MLHGHVTLTVDNNLLNCFFVDNGGYLNTYNKPSGILYTFIIFVYLYTYNICKLISYIPMGYGEYKTRHV